MAKGSHSGPGGDRGDHHPVTPSQGHGRPSGPDESVDGRSELFDQLARPAPAGEGAGGDPTRISPASVMAGADGRSLLVEQFARPSAAAGATDAERSRLLVEALTSMMGGADGRSLLAEQFGRPAAPGQEQNDATRLAATLLSMQAPGADGRSALFEQLAKALPVEGAGGSPATVADLLRSVLAAPDGRSLLLQQLARSGSTAEATSPSPEPAPLPRATPPAPAAPAKELTPGTVIGRFELLKEIGRGGFGVVFEAQDRDLKRSVAFKAVRPGVRSPQLDTMLLQEAESAARLQHENIVAIFDYGKCEAGPYLVLELLKGKTLAERLTQGHVPVPEVVHVGLQVSRALAHAHGSGLLHRDLKPGNVFLTESGGVKVMDLGLAHFVGQSAGLSGTPAYMAPEQWKGEAQDGRTDVFALGVTLFELLAGHRPYEVRKDRSTVLDPGPEPKLEHAHVPPRLKKLVERCIAKDPAKRPPSALAVQEELLAVERDFGKKTTRREQMFLVLLLGGVLTVLGVGGIAAWKLWPKPISKEAPRTVLVADFENRTGEEVFNGTLEPAIGLTLEGAQFVSSYSRGAARRTADQLKLEGTGLDEKRARLVAQREGVATVVSGFVDKDGSGYKLGARTVDAFSGKTLMERTEPASDRGAVLAAASKLAAKVRGALGDTTPESTLLKEAETFSASSLEAAHEYSVANDLALTQGKYAEARKHYEEAIRLDPGMGRAYTGLAVMLANRGQAAEADAYFQKGLNLVDRMTEREKFRTRGSYYMFKRDADKSIEVYEGLVKQFPADNAGLANLGLAYVFKGDFPRALEYTRKALALYPQNVPQRNNAGYFAMYAGDFPAAITDQKKVLEINPGFVNGYIGLALAQEANGQRDEAVATWKKLEALGPSEASAAVEGLADLAALEGRLGDARAALEKGIQDDLRQKSDADAARKLAMLAGVLVARGDAPRAVEPATRAAALSQQDYVQYLAARALLEAGQEKKALAIADGLGKRFEAAPRVYGQLIQGAAALQRKNPTEAIAHFKDAQKALDHWLVRYELGRAYLAANAPAQAQDELETAYRRRGEVTDVFVDNVPTYRLLGPVLYWKARAQEAQKSPAAADTYRAFLATKQGDEDPLVKDARKRIAAP